MFRNRAARTAGFAGLIRSTRRFALQHQKEMLRDKAARRKLVYLFISFNVFILEAIGHFDRGTFGIN
ncbi:MAG: hypothetical protein ACJAQ2_001781 [Vicingaceae bacterium]|jgi:hypothetical protein